MAATQLDFLRAKVIAYKNTLEAKSSTEKNKHVAIAVAQQFNGFLEEIKKESSVAAPHLPHPVTWKGHAADFQKADVTYLDLELLVNQVLAVLDVVRGSD